MKSLFAPWRMKFIESHDSSRGCVLCEIPKASEGDDVMQILGRGKLAYVVMNKYPYSNGHLMVIPFRHEKDWNLLSPEELLEISTLTQKALAALKKAIEPQGFNIGVNLGRAAGAGIDDHVHQHIVPRWVGDTNFMPLFSETKVISEHLDATFRRLKEAWLSLEQGKK